MENIMAHVCPISRTVVNKNVVMFSAAVTFSLLLLFVLTQNPFILIFLAGDFFIRGFIKSKFSPIVFFGTAVVNAAGCDPKMINSGPKKFAAKVGFTMTVTVLALWYAGLIIPSLALATIFITLTGTESLFGFCLACEIYSWMMVLRK